MTPEIAICNALNHYAATQVIHSCELDKVADHITSHIRKHYGYVVKRAVPPCRGHDLGGDDASDE